jgi:hypothetical protein
LGAISLSEPFTPFTALNYKGNPDFGLFTRVKGCDPEIVNDFCEVKGVKGKKMCGSRARLMPEPLERFDSIKSSEFEFDCRGFARWRGYYRVGESGTVAGLQHLSRRVLPTCPTATPPYTLIYIYL